MKGSVQQITADEARIAALRAQGLLGTDLNGGVHGLLRRVGAVQLDTISVLARSHELVAYARLGDAGRITVEEAYWGQPARAFEYYAHANCVLPIEAWPFFSFRRRQWRERPMHSLSARVLREVRARLRDGPATASDLGGARKDHGGWWNWSESKHAIEMLYRWGEVVCVSRRGWKRIYDLPERRLSSRIRGAEPSDAECFRYLVRCAGRALGVGTRRDIANYFRLTTRPVGSPPDAHRLLDAAIADSGLVPVRVEGWRETAFADPIALQSLAREEHRVTLLSPFDSLVWERERTERLFGFTLSLEAYVPRAKRVHGYFTMPLLADGRLLGRVDPARDGKTLVIRKLTLDDRSAVPAMASALREAASWVGCDSVHVEQVYPRRIAGAMRKAVL
jgi:uncharacterized protein